MIRHLRQNEYLLFTQDDHARLSGALAEHWGNARFGGPSPREPVVTAVTLHDAGWPEHDARPVLNLQGHPMHVFETPAVLGTQIWSESARAASQAGDYAGLLVSLHVLALSSIAQAHLAGSGSRMLHAEELFELNKFQQNQIELQENFRHRLGLRTDVALHYGLAARGASPQEDKLLFDYNVLKALDRISLAVLCSDSPFDSIDGIFTTPGGVQIELRLSCASEFSLRVDPWPFAASSIELVVPVRRIPARTYASVEELREVFNQTGVEEQVVTIQS